jgi:hypothetical protein
MKSIFLWSAVSLTPLTTIKVDFIVEYLREYEAIFKKALTRVSGPLMELFDEKTRGRKSRDRVPLRWAHVTIFRFYTDVSVVSYFSDKMHFDIAGF